MKKAFIALSIVLNACLMNGSDLVAKLPPEIPLTTFHFEMIDGIWKLTTKARDLIGANFTQADGSVSTDRALSFVGSAFDLGWEARDKDNFRDLVACFYDTKPKQIALGLGVLIVVSSVTYSGVKAFYFTKEKFNRWRQKSTEQSDELNN